MVLVGLIIAIGWTSFAPVAVGGEASYVITEGESMLPTLRSQRFGGHARPGLLRYR